MWTLEKPRWDWIHWTNGTSFHSFATAFANNPWSLEFFNPPSSFPSWICVSGLSHRKRIGTLMLGHPEDLNLIGGTPWRNSDAELFSPSSTLSKLLQNTHLRRWTYTEMYSHGSSQNSRPTTELWIPALLDVCGSAPCSIAVEQFGKNNISGQIFSSSSENEGQKVVYI